MLALLALHAMRAVLAVPARDQICSIIQAKTRPIDDCREASEVPICAEYKDSGQLGQRRLLALPRRGCQWIQCPRRAARDPIICGAPRTAGDHAHRFARRPGEVGGSCFLVEI
jgi:hypothetical protein